MMRRHFLGSCLFFLAGALRANEPAPAVDLSGQWAGTWQSCTSGHRGPLRATFCRCSDACYEVRFQGRFFAVVPFRYTVQLRVTGQADGQVFLSGSSNLPLFGTFQYSAVATENEFRAEYSSRSDNGRFSLCR